ncbi:Uncharacterized protein BP5553_04905 [Venustampulla echinocandica]|uniref:PXA domain-containing protein n=1 Tax=Venustampulla echinocandica TaxID=2656787 RepID=A0A370TPN1_9HELO|nr:Uncharacterized protein BP5553_04905 [Venustampulla echinocandica]RDL37472.1 Uncharacterized protein BP5553_04905 [Venustampulla echinocandica]
MNGTGGDSKSSDGLIDALESAPTDAKGANTSKDSPTGPEDLVTRALRFLSTASVETIGAIAVGLAASTYLILGKLGLVLIGALGGVVLHATWEGQSDAPGILENARREKSLDVITRVLEWRTVKIEAQEEEDDNSIVGATFEGFRPETAAALNELVEAVIQNYVKWWYNPILPSDQSFPAVSRQTLTRFILSIANHLSRKRPADTFLDFLTNSSSIVIVFLSELSSALSSTQGTNVPAAEAVYAYLSANPDSNLANVLNEKQHMKKFKMVADDVLQNFLEKPVYNCDPARVFLREILAGVMLDMTLKSWSKPEWINGWIVYLLEDGEPDFNQAIDAGMGNATDLSSPFNDIDGNVGNVGLAKAPKSPQSPREIRAQESKGHKKRLSKAEEAMEEAMEEAKRLSQLIAEEEAKNGPATGTSVDDVPKPLETAVERNPLGSAPSIAASISDVSQQDSSSSSPSLVQDRSSSVESPVSPNSSTSAPPQPPRDAAPFTSFDQIVPPAQVSALQEEPPRPRRKTIALTLQNANIVIHDDSTANDKGKIRNKPNGDYLIQIEPASSDHPGWMIVRRYPDFETLHEVLRRIAQISGVAAFTEQHNLLPNWKEHTKSSLRGELERYLREACWHQSLAESEGMKRFLEKDQGQSMSGSGSKNGFPGIGWPTPSAFETMGKGMLDVLTSAPKGVAEGGKVIGGGITGVFSNIGNLGQKKANGSSSNVSTHSAGRASTSTLPRIDSINSTTSSRRGRMSEDSLRAVPVVQTQPSKLPPMERRPSYNSIAEDNEERDAPYPTSSRSSMSGRRSAVHSRDPSRAPSRKGTPISSPTQLFIDELKLPPPPSAIDENYGTQGSDSHISHAHKESIASVGRTSTSTAPSQQSPGRPSLSAARRSSVQVNQTPRKIRKEPTPVTEAETRVAVELLFAVISELYTLSSAWKFRRTLLNAAKTFLLRPGNPSLSSIQSLIQDSVIASNASDSGMAAHLLKLRENTMPTEEELKAWPAEMSMEEKERLRIKARKLLVERGVPTALTGVMGQAATGEAMGKIFDCLQIEEVNRGLMFGMILQCVRAVTQ